MHLRRQVLSQYWPLRARDFILVDRKRIDLFFGHRGCRNIVSIQCSQSFIICRWETEQYITNPTNIPQISGTLGIMLHTQVIEFPIKKSKLEPKTLQPSSGCKCYGWWHVKSQFCVAKQATSCNCMSLCLSLKLLTSCVHPQSCCHKEDTEY